MDNHMTERGTSERMGYYADGPPMWKQTGGATTLFLSDGGTIPICEFDHSGSVRPQFILLLCFLARESVGPSFDCEYTMVYTCIHPLTGGFGSGTLDREKSKHVEVDDGKRTGRSDQVNTMQRKSYPPEKKRIQPGSAKGMTYYMAEDFDEPLPEFSDEPTPPARMRS
jgi:hypothetical protein